MKMNLKDVNNLGSTILTGTVPNAPFVGDVFKSSLSKACACLTTNPALNERNIATAFEKNNGPALIAVNTENISSPQIAGLSGMSKDRSGREV